MLPRVFSSKRRKAFGGSAAVLVVGLVAVGAALAYYGGSGSGSATASAGHAPRAVTVTGSCVLAGPNPCPLYPGGTGLVEISIALTGQGNAHVGAVSLDTSQGDNGIGGLPVGCDRDWFSFTPPVANGPDFPAGANVTEGTPLNVSGTLDFMESGTLQDACSDAALILYLQASPS